MIFQALGQGLTWGTKQFHSDESIDAKLLGCACCGIREYENKNKPTAKKKLNLSYKQARHFEIDKRRLSGLQRKIENRIVTS